MIGAQGRVPVFAYRQPVDLRKGFEGLSALVQQALGKDPLSGALYLFTNRRRTTAKVLQFDGTGLTLYIKRLARGRFAALWEGDDTTALHQLWAQDVALGEYWRTAWTGTPSDTNYDWRFRILHAVDADSFDMGYVSDNYGW